MVTAMHDQSPPAVSRPAAPAPVVTVSGVTHRFGDAVALDRLSFEVPAGEITVLLGPNGAGKTTAFRTITGALVPSEGQVRAFGLDPVDDGHVVRTRCGVVSAKPALYDRLSGHDNLVYAAELYGMRDAVEERIGAAATRFGIESALDQMVGGYSTGMKTRLALARAILHDPELLLFDEPTSGLDPESAHAVLALIREMTRDGHTVVMCTHLLAEAEGLADHVVMIEAGAAIAAGSPRDLTRRYWPHPILHLGAEDARLLDRIAAWEGVVSYRRDTAGARVEIDDLDRVPGLVAALCADGVRLTRVDPRQPTLEDLYFAIRRGSASGARGGLGPVAAPRHAPPAGDSESMPVLDPLRDPAAPHPLEERTVR